MEDPAGVRRRVASYWYRALLEQFEDHVVAWSKWTALQWEEVWPAIVSRAEQGSSQPSAYSYLEDLRVWWLLRLGERGELLQIRGALEAIAWWQLWTGVELPGGHRAVFVQKSV